MNTKARKAKAAEKKRLEEAWDGFVPDAPEPLGPAPRGGWGYKAYGKATWFRTRRELMEHALEWLMSTEGAEQERAASILSAAEAHVRFTDTDASAREGAVSLDEAGLPA